MEFDSKTTLIPGEAHPASLSALDFVQSRGLVTQCLQREAYASCAIEGNRLAEICGETLRRVSCCEGVSDRYILGLAWNMMTSQLKFEVEELLESCDDTGCSGDLVVCSKRAINRLLELAGVDGSLEPLPDNANQED